MQQATKVEEKPRCIQLNISGQAMVHTREHTGEKLNNCTTMEQKPIKSIEAVLHCHSISLEPEKKYKVGRNPTKATTSEAQVNLHTKVSLGKLTAFKPSVTRHFQFRGLIKFQNYIAVCCMLR